MDEDRTEGAPEELDLRGDLHEERLILDRAIGGWRGIVDSGLPTAVFLIAYVFSESNLMLSAISALVVVAILSVIALVRHASLQQVGAGAAGVAIAAAFSMWTGRAEDFFLPGIITNLAYGSAFLISILVGWPLLGLIIGYLTGQGTDWRSEPSLRRIFAAASWIWVGLFFGRLLVQLPLYLAGAVEALGIVKIVLGWPAFLAAAYFTYRLLAPTYRRLRENKSA